VRSRLRQWVAAGLVCASAAIAQGPVAHSGTYGPPVCDPAGKLADRGAVFTAEAEQQQGGVDAQALAAMEPENFGVERMRLAAYGDCVRTAECYWADLDAQYVRAQRELANEVARKRVGERLAMVMDIDETTLTNYCEMKREDFGYIPSLYMPWEVGSQSAMPIAGALRLFAEAKKDGVAVFFITGRHGAAGPGTAGAIGMDETEGTKRNLIAAGFKGWDGLALRTGDELTMHTILYKAAERQKIVTQGYRIVLSVGDQWSDLLGQPQADVSVKLPNPFYFIP
jgi:hypothetical protein